MNKTQVLIVTSEFPPQPGGIGNHAYNLALQLSRKGYEVTLIADQRSRDAYQEELFDAALPFHVKRIAITNPRFLMYIRRIIVLFKAMKFTDHVFASGKFSLWSVAFVSVFYDRNNIAVVHGTEVNFKGFLLRYSINLALRRFTSVVAVSNFTKKLIAHLQLNVRVIPNGYDPEKWVDSSHKDIKLKGFPKLVTVGNVTSRKGQQNVIKMLPSLLKRFPEIHYHCVGLLTEADDFIKLARELHVDSHVSFHGRIEDTDLQAMLLQTDIFVMLSSETKSGDVEGFGIAILEANSLGVPAIGSINCGIEDAIESSVSGLLVDPLNENEFAEGVARIMNDSANYASGAKLWARKHEWSIISDQYILLLK